MDHTKLIKIAVVGDSTVGKSSIITRYTENIFSMNTISTHGMDTRTKKVNLNGEECRLCLWDTAGQEQYRSITMNFFRKSCGIVVVFDLTNYESYENLERWFKDIDELTEGNLLKIVVGNKADLKEKRAIDRSVVENYCSKKGVEYFEVSAKDGTGVEDLFEHLLYRETKGSVLQEFKAQQQNDQKVGRFSIMKNGSGSSNSLKKDDDEHASKCCSFL